ncbi:MAG: YegS/Rv2252/BmrU family lipid kinase [Nitriliruptorales bacterium]|nr:YegS/Rv2252/BmrU family lipid kinase [Nitriliruptorales bacterium]
MSSPHGPMRLIVNPRAGRGIVGKTMPELTDALRGQGLQFDVVETKGARQASQAATEALRHGIRYLVAVGGDGTVHEVVNGMFDGTEAIAPDAVLGVAAAGSGCDFVRTFGLDRKPKVIAKHLAGDATMDIDVGVVEYADLDGKPASSLFANIAEVGYGAEVVRRAERYPRWFGRLRYLIGAYSAIMRTPRPETTVTVDHTSKTVPLVELVVANCQFFGGAMKVAPRALPDDGKFNVQLYTGQRSQVFTLTMKIYRGEHLPHPDITEYQSSTVSLTPDPALLVEADGEVLGTTPAQFRLLPRALRLKI